MLLDNIINTSEDLSFDAEQTVSFLPSIPLQTMPDLLRCRLKLLSRGVDCVYAFCRITQVKLIGLR